MSDDNTTLADVDQEIVLEFLDESADGLNTVSNLLVQLETDPNDIALINAIFRPVHSLKGNSAFFGLMKVKDLSHKMENLLDKLRKEQLLATTAITEVLLEGVDMLTTMIARVRESKSEIDDDTSLNELVARLQSVCEGGSADVDPALGKLIEKLDKIRLRLGKTDKSLVTDLESIIFSIKSFVPGKQGKADKEPVSVPASPEGKLKELLSNKTDSSFTTEKANEVLALFETLRDGVSAKETIEDLDQSINIWHVFMNSGVGFDDLCRETLLGRIESLIKKNALGRKTVSPGKEGSAAAESNKETKAAESAGVSKTMRVNEDSIDTFLEYVGELLVVGDMFTNIQNQLDVFEGAKTLASRFRMVNETFGVLSDGLRNSIMSIRKVAMDTIIQKAPRMVRDIAKHSGKDISVKLEGGGVSVDKSLLDIFDAPLTHMVRNASDHGIEMPDDREKAGKGRQGVITVSVTETNTQIVLCVQDDGAGINYEAIQAKGVSLGLVKQGEAMTDKQVVDLLFAAGVSTAKEVTDVSGRGVGMDVVKRAIDEGGGSIDVHTVQGKGSTFTVKMPKSVTTQIMDGFLVRVAESTYVLPMKNVLDASRIEPDDIHTVSGKGQCVQHQGNLCPVFYLADILGGSDETTGNGEARIMIALSAVSKKLGLIVDEAVGIQQVVVRKIEGVSVDSDVVSGGALMGDGNVALILDVESLAMAGGREREG